MGEVQLGVGLLFVGNRTGYYLAVAMAVLFLPVLAWACASVPSDILLWMILVTGLVESSLIGSAIYLRKQVKVGKESPYYIELKEGGRVSAGDEGLTRRKI